MAGIDADHCLTAHIEFMPPTSLKHGIAAAGAAPVGSGHHAAAN
jgi:hypothetical protein